MSRFGPDPKAFFDAVYADAAPWDIGDVQPAMAAMLAILPPAGPALDLGCGAGDHAVHLARLGLDVLGVDFAAAAISRARAKASAEPEEVRQRLEFLEADGLRPSRLERRFATVLDSGFLHLFDPEAGAALARELADVLTPSGRYYLLAFDIEFDAPHVPRRISRDEVRGLFPDEDGWRILDLRSAQFLSRVAPPVPAVSACIEWQPARARTRPRSS